MPNKIQSTHYKWFILLLGSITNTLVIAMPGMSLSVLLPEISSDLNLDLVQAGFLWGLPSLASIFAFILAGILIDRFGTKPILIISCLLTGLIGAARGLAQDYPTLILTAFFLGFFTPFISISNIKNGGTWFPERQSGLANGILALGMALGFFLGAMISASFISPWLGGWRPTFLLYGLVALLFAIPWGLSRPYPVKQSTTSPKPKKNSTWGSVKHVTSAGSLWLLGIALLCYNGSVQGLLGYLPLYLRNLGWEPLNADSLTASFHLASIIGVIPLSLLSDRLPSKKPLVLITSAMTALGIGLFFAFKGGILWASVLGAGLARDAIMAIVITMIIATKGIGKDYAGIATGFVLIFTGLGSLLAPPIGNKLAELAPNLPFLFWAILCTVCVISIALVKETKKTKGITAPVIAE